MSGHPAFQRTVRIPRIWCVLCPWVHLRRPSNGHWPIDTKLHILTDKAPFTWPPGEMASRLTTNQEIAGSTPAVVISFGSFWPVESLALISDRRPRCVMYVLCIPAPHAHPGDLRRLRDAGDWPYQEVRPAQAWHDLAFPQLGHNRCRYISTAHREEGGLAKSWKVCMSLVVTVTVFIGCTCTYRIHTYIHSMMFVVYLQHYNTKLVYFTFSRSLCCEDMGDSDVHRA